MTALPTFLQTERLELRVPRAGEGGLVTTAVVESLPALRAWLAWATVVPTVEETETRIRTQAAQFADGTDYTFTLWLRNEETVAGKISLHPIYPDVPSFEIGYWCRTRFAGQGLMTEAASAVANAAFVYLDAVRLEIRCDPRNLASRKVAERCGFALEAHLRNEQRAPDGSLRDTLIYTRFNPSLPAISSPSG